MFRVLLKSRNPGRHHQHRPRAFCGTGEHRVKAGAIDVPAAAVGIEEEVVMASGRRFPSRADTLGLQPLGLQKLIPDSQLRQQPSYFRGHRFTHTKILVGGSLDDRHLKSAAAQIERYDCAGGTAARDEHII